MANYADARMHHLPGNSQNGELNRYQDSKRPSIEYHGIKETHKGLRAWYAIDTQTEQKWGPFGTVRSAWEFVQTVPETNGKTEESEPTNDQIIEFNCPHCGAGIIGLVARK